MENSINKILDAVKKNISSKEYDLAIENLKKVILIEPKHLAALSTLSDLFVFKKNYLESINFLNKIIEINPKLHFIYNNKGFCLLSLNKIEEAKVCFEMAIKYKEDFSEAYNNFGIAFKKQKNLNEARKYFIKAINLNKKYIQAYSNLISVDIELNNLSSAKTYCEEAIKINSNIKELYNSLGLIFDKKNEVEKSIFFFKKALSISPNYLASIINLARIYLTKNDYKNSSINFRKALDIDQNNIKALSNFIYLKLKICDWDNLEELLKKLFIDMDKNHQLIQPYILLLLKDDVKLQYENTRKWSRQYETSKINSFKSNNKKIKIGYFSTDFKNHAVISLAKNLFKNHDKKKFDIFGINLSNKFFKKDIDINLIQSFNEFIDCGYKSNNEIADICKKINLDFAIDMNCHTEGGRIDIFQNKLAPIQINFLGYPGTCGNKFFDYILADRILIAENDRKYYSEKIIFMPDTYQPNSFSSSRSPSNQIKKDLLIPKEKFVFCCFNNSFKINKLIFDMWVEILKQSNNSIIWLLEDNLIQSENLKKNFENQGINSSRIIFTKRVEYQQHLDRFIQADLFLDTFPYGGHTTAIEALNADLPILTLKGETFQSRVSSSLLTNLNLIELITDSKHNYIKLAVELSQNSDKLIKLKQKLRENKKNSKVFDNKIYTKNLEDALERIHLSFTLGKKLENIYL